jgi:hypothetical protein
MDSKKVGFDFFRVVWWNIANEVVEKAIRIYQNTGAKADRIRDCLNTLGLSYSEKDPSHLLEMKTCVSIFIRKVSP